MKKYISFLFAAGMILSGASLLGACDDKVSEFPPKPEQDAEAAPKVKATIPAMDATSAETGKEIVIEYDRKIYITPVTTISVNGEFVDEGIEVRDETKLVIPFVTYPGTKYTVNVTNPSVRDENYNFSPTLEYSFITRALNVIDPGMFQIDKAPVNPNATPQAVKLYNLMVDNFGRRVFTGAVAQGCHDIISANILKSMTGQHPAINCFDFMEHYQQAPVNPKGWASSNYNDITVDKDWAEKGGIVSYQWHWEVPQTEADKDNFNKYAFYCNGSGGGSNTDFLPANALKEGTWERAVIDRDIDAIAGYLLNLQQAGIPVLWRPLHEAAGNTNLYTGGKAWFWWGNSGPEAFRKLWVYLYDRLKAKGVNNLIWVWTSCGNDADWYPGDQYVDIIGLDYYENDPEKYHLSLADKMGYLHGISSHKVLALSEAGALPSMEAITEGGDMWAYMIPWNGQYTTDPSINSPAFFKAFFEDDRVITRDKMIPIK